MNNDNIDQYYICTLISLMVGFQIIEKDGN
jgi:hypothetical protein